MRLLLPAVTLLAAGFALLVIGVLAMVMMMEGHWGTMGAGRGAQEPVVSLEDEVTVEISGFDFVPRDLSVPAGAAVTWVNRDGAPHDATDIGGAWATPLLQRGQPATLPFDEPGRFDYYCSVHPNMKATLTVRQPGEQ
jgi:plastocyanin